MPGAVVVVLRGHGPRALARWRRHLGSAEVEVVADGGPAPGAGVVVTVDGGVRLPTWPWLPRLLEALAASPVDAVQPPLVDEAHLLLGPLLPGHPVSSLDPLDGALLPRPLPGVEARRAGTTGPAALTTRTWLPARIDPASGAEDRTWTALAARATQVTPHPGTPSLRWSVDIAAPAAPIGRRWGDWGFARALAAALGRLGQRVEIDHPETRARATRAGVDVVLGLRGLTPVAGRTAATSDAVHLLWVISHPDHVTADELAAADVGLAASERWASAHGLRWLPQATDTTRFHPGVEAAPYGPTGHALFVGHARGGMRPVVAAALAAGLPLTVVGRGWDRYDVTALADRLPDADLPGAYAGAAVVLADHHADMAGHGFVANRVLDVLAVGGRLLVDEVPGLDALVGAPAVTWREPADLERLVRPPYDAWPDATERRALARRVVAEHSFDRRARVLLDAVLAKLEVRR